MNNIEIFLPIALLTIGFILKVVVGQDWKDVINLFQNICELPVDIIFLSLSFAVAFTITSSSNFGIGLSYCFIGVAFAILIILVRKISIDLLFDKKKIVILIVLINLTVSGFVIRESIKLIINEPTTFSEIFNVNNEPDIEVDQSGKN